jgi:cyclophilin family peptidyl-prolyl cis-trans isomerase/HEAT repeat protein
MIKNLLLLGCVAALAGCTATTPVNPFSDETLRKIADYQDRRLSDSLYQFFRHPNPVYRERAILSFGSIQDTAAIPSLSNILMNDTSITVRRAAAFALGQTRNLQAETVLLQALSTSSSTVRDEVFEALGKIGSKTLDTIKTTLVRGLVWGAYRLALQGRGESLTSSVIPLLKHQEKEVRVVAAHFFSRSSFALEGNVNAEEALTQGAMHDVEPDVRMAAVLALRKIKTDSSMNAIIRVFRYDDDYRVRVNAIRALQVFPLAKTKAVLLQALKDKNINTAIAASEVIKAKASAEPDSAWWHVAGSTMNWRVKANLYEATIRTIDNPGLIDEIKSQIVRSNNPYEKAALVQVLQYTPSEHAFLEALLLKGDTPIVRSTAAAALAGLHELKKFDDAWKKQYLVTCEKAITTSNDPTVIGVLAIPLGNPAYGYNKIVQQVRFLYHAKEKLTLPQDNEALQPLEAALAYFENREPQPVINTFNHPINWSLIQTVSPVQRARIRTTKGDITIRLLVSEAPGSVANFVDLVNKQYFKGKFFHRVVPNFVIQAGCNRGDGYGSEDYSIRSEFTTRKYTTGSVGMASAGKDTEGTQWFITHSPTPHLDGRYTIFAEVEEGMDVVHGIEVGDQILSVTLIQ